MTKKRRRHTPEEIIRKLDEGCSDNDDPSWECRTSPLGNATLEWRGVTAWIPYLIGVVAGCVMCALLGLAQRMWVNAKARLDATGRHLIAGLVPMRGLTIGRNLAGGGAR